MSFLNLRDEWGPVPAASGISQQEPIMTQPPNYQAPMQEPPKGMAIASMVLGIVSLVICTPYVSIPCGIIALSLGVVAKGKVKRGEGGGGGMATAGIICSIIALALAVLIIILGIAGFAFMHSHPGMFQVPGQTPAPAPAPAPTNP
jgi:hypothetical protein